MERTAGPIIAVCLMIAIAAGLYAWKLNGDLVDARQANAMAMKNADTAKADADSMKARLTSGSADLDSCKTQLQDQTQRADAAEQQLQSAQSRSAGGRR